MSFCPGCGETVNEGQRFCGKCGATITSEPIVQEPVMQPQVFSYEQPVYATDTPPVTAPKAPKYKERRIYTRRNAGRKALTVILCMVLCVSGLAAALLYNIRGIVSAEGAQKLVKEMIVDKELLEMPAEDLLDVDHYGTVEEYIIDSIAQANGGYISFDDDDFEQYLEKSYVVDLISEKVGSLVEITISGEGKCKLTESELRKALRKDQDLIERYLDIYISDEDIEYAVDELAASDMFGEVEAEDLNMPEMMTSAQEIVSEDNLWIVLAVSVFCILIIGFVNRWDIGYIGIDFGVTFIVVGCLAGIPAALFDVLEDMLEEAGEFSSVISSLIEQVSSRFMTTGGVIAGVGIFLIIVALIFRKTAKVK